MLKYLQIINLLIMMVATQDILPTDLEPPIPELTTIEPDTTTMEEESFTTEAPTTTTTESIDTTISTIRNDIPISPVTESHFPTLAPNYPFRPSYPDYSGMRCYIKKQYGRIQYRWTCIGVKYFYPVTCYKCCQFQNSSFAGCCRIQTYQCN